MVGSGVAITRKPTRLVVISGLSVTGTTSLTRLVAEALGWRAVFVGERFREYARTHNLSLTSIPIEAHREFDELVRSELATSERAVLDGRYLGYFAREYADILRVRLDANVSTRIARTCDRADGRLTAEQAKQSLLQRDQAERDIFSRMYGAHDFLDTQFFGLTLANDEGALLSDLAARVVDQVPA